MRNSVKKVTTSKKPVVRKPMMKKGGTKKVLKKAQYGDTMMGTPTLKDVGVKNIYQGPLNESDYKNLNTLYPINNESPRSQSTVTAPKVLQKDKTIKGPKVKMYESDANQYMQDRVANYLRSGKQLESDDLGVYAPKEKDIYSTESKKRGGAKKPMMKKGGSVKKTLTKAQDGKIIKSKKVRTANMNTFGPSTASVSKTKKDGSAVTKSVNTNQGYVPSASKTKSITDSQGNTTSSTKDMSWNKAVKKQSRMAKRVGRNPNDELSINKKGGAIKSKTVAKPKMAKGGSAKVNISKPGAGFTKATKGGSNASMGIYGVPNAGMTGPNRNSVTETMQRGGAKKPSKKYVDSKIKINSKSPERPMPKPMMAKKGGSTKSFPDLNKDGKVTRADILKGRGVIKKKGGIIKKKK
jgi:hypothetical protein